jgi:hypothetical protein
MDAIDTDKSSQIFLGGRTQSNRLWDGTNGCYDSSYTGKYRGYIARYSHTSKVWHRVYEFDSPDYVVSVPYVGLSYCA